MTQPQAYRVIWTGEARRDAEQLRDTAVSRGASAARQLAVQLRKINEALMWVPAEWGEAFMEMTFMKLIVCVGFLEELVINYGIDEAQKIVYIRQVRCMKQLPH